MQLTTRHKEFCKLVAEGLKAAPAYQKAYKKKDSIVCRVAACNLLKKPEIKAEIERVRKLAAKIAEKAEQKAMEAIAEKVGAEIADKAERMAHLTRIMRGQERVRSDKFFFDGKTGEVVVQEVYELPDAQAQSSYCGVKQDGWQLYHKYQPHSKRQQSAKLVESINTAFCAV